MRWLFALIVFVSPAMAEEVTTENVLPDMSAFIASGSTQPGYGCSAGQYCTGNASNGGGTYTSSFDVPLTEAEVRRGFTLNHSVDVNSHSSNASLSTCSSITQSGDCRDVFRMTVALFDITNTVVEKFERNVELDFGGTQTFSFAEEVSANSFSILTGEFELWGIDAGFHSGAYGPQFSEPGLAFTYQNVVEQQVLDQIVQMDTEIVFTPTPPITEIAASPPPPAMTQPVQTAATEYAEPSAPAPPPVVAEIQTAQPEPQEQQQEAEVEAAIETEMQAEPEPQPEPEQQAEAEPEPEQQAEAEQQAEPQEAVEAEPEPEPEQQQAEAEPETKQEKQKAAAERVVKKIAPSQRYSAVSQATTMVVMNMLAGKIATDVTMVDTQGFFPVTGMNDDRSMSNPLQDYTMFGGSNAAHGRFMQLEWSR